MTPPRAWLALLSCAAVLTASSWYAGSPARADADPTGPPTSVTVFLEPPDPAALAALAAQPIVDRAERLRQLALLVPSPAQHHDVAAVLDAEGFDVTDETTWSVTATARRSVVTDTFGTRPTVTADSTAAQTRAAAGPLSEVPASLDGLVSAVYPTTGGPAPFKPAATGALVGADLRNASTNAGGAPSSGQNDAGLTVATIQLSNWQNNDLTQYAASHGLPDPVASGQYQQETVGVGPNTASGAVEVDLDQQSILSTAPTARQHAYFARNNPAGFQNAFSAVYDDVTTTEPGIAALSVSWGGCEAGMGAASINGFQPILQSLVAAGVTIFASSGDAGIYDCPPSVIGVDFPASSPYVVAVGGTNLSAAASAPNTGANWTETAWSCLGAASCTSSSGGGSGGGVSAGFAKPAYQSTYVTTAPFVIATQRLVPDIAAVGDPHTGFTIYHQGATAQYGGTSLAAPVSAALLTNLLGDSARTTGLGDIHTRLYQAYAATSCLTATDPARAFRDVTVGSNGDPADAGGDPSVSAAVGYDTVTGLGGVLWPAIAPYLFGVAGPVACPATPAVLGSIANTAQLKLRNVGRGDHRHQVVAGTWSTTATGSTVAAVTVRVSSGRATKYAGSAPAGHTQVRARPGHTYTITITSTDSQGHTATTSKHVKVKRHRHRPR